MEYYIQTTELDELIRLVPQSDEEKRIKFLTGEFLFRKKDFKFKINPNYTNLSELAEEFCTKVMPILYYVHMKLQTENNLIAAKRIEDIMKTVSCDKICHFYFTSSSNDYSSIARKFKLNYLLMTEEILLKKILLFVYSLTPARDRPIRPDTVGLGVEEFEQIDNL